METDINGFTRTFYSWDAIPDIYKPFLEEGMADPGSQLWTATFGARWLPEAVRIGSEIDVMHRDIGRKDNKFEFSDIYSTQEKYEGKYWDQYFGNGYGYSAVPEAIAPPRPSKIHILYPPGSKKHLSFLSGFHDVSQPNGLICGEDVYEILTALYDIPSDRWFPLSVDFKGEDVGRMYLFDPETRNDLIDFEHSEQDWKYKPESVLGPERWISHVRRPGILPGKTISIARAGCTSVGNFLICKDLRETFRVNGVLGLSFTYDPYQEAWGHHYEPRVLYRLKDKGGSVK